MTYIVEESFSDCDWTWVGQDRNGLLATFTTAGEGPSPISLFNLAKRDEIYSIEDEVLKLPEVSSVILNPKINYKTVESFLKLSRRGFFSFDWSDVHEKGSHKKRVYELVSEPKTPLKFSSLSRDESKLLFVISLPEVDFTLRDIESIRA